MKKITYIIIVILVLIITVIIYGGDQNINKCNTYKPKVEKIIHVEKLSGALFPLTQIELKSRLSGILDQYYVELGQKVNKGQPIARIKIIPDPQAIEQAKKNHETSRVKFLLQQNIYNRQKKLFKNGVISNSEMEKEESEYLVMKEEYVTSQQLYEIALNGFSSKNPIISDVVKATTSGTIVDLPLNIGSNIIERNNFNEGTSIATIADLENYIFRSNINEMLIQKIKLGTELFIHVNSLQKLDFSGLISKISPVGIKDEGVVKFNIEVLLDKKYDFSLLKPGFTAVADLIVESDSNSLVIEERDIFISNDSIYVQVLNKDSNLENKLIKVGMSDGIKTAVVSGLDSTNLIVIQ